MSPPPDIEGGRPRGDVEATVTRILQLLFSVRRLAPQSRRCDPSPCPACFGTHAGKIAAAVRRRVPVHFVILGFPAKSPNRRKVLGTLPDLAERVALEFLQVMCDQIAYFHRPGARITICSDGHVFNDIVGVSDGDVSAYRQEVLVMLGALGTENLELFTLDDALSSRTYLEKREALESRYGPPLEDHPRWSEESGDQRRLFDGIHRFLFEDFSVLWPSLSRSKVRTECKQLAYRLIRRSTAWSQLVSEAFPEAIRLSIHPQSPHSDKLGIHLARTRDSWMTPWHGVVLDDGRGLTLVKRGDAEALNASIVWRHGRPSHFMLPHIILDEVEYDPAIGSFRRSPALMHAT